MNFLPASRMGTACRGTNPNQSRLGEKLEPRDPADPASGQGAPLIQSWGAQCALRSLIVSTTTDHPGRKTSGGDFFSTVLSSWFYFPTDSVGEKKLARTEPVLPGFHCWRRSAVLDAERNPLTTSNKSSGTTECLWTTHTHSVRGQLFIPSIPLGGKCGSG